MRVLMREWGGAEGARGLRAATRDEDGARWFVERSAAHRCIRAWKGQVRIMEPEIDRCQHLATRPQARTPPTLPSIDSRQFSRHFQRHFGKGNILFYEPLPPSRADERHFPAIFPRPVSCRVTRSDPIRIRRLAGHAQRADVVLYFRLWKAKVSTLRRLFVGALTVAHGQQRSTLKRAFAR